ncbi:hypothetical protein [Pedobacter sp.]|uniref:hypothetical protein n=1 Tax=Pedobacter sp. TaxID=1411316 RepID=UPI003BAA10FB
MMSVVAHRSPESSPLFAFQKMLEVIFKAANDVEHDVKECSKLRETRKLLKSVSPGLVNLFIETDEENRSLLEDKVVSLKNRARLLIHKINNGSIHFKHSLTKTFVLRELRLFVSIFSSLHEEFSSHIYSKPALTLPEEHPLAKKVIATWGEHSFQDC